MLFGSGVGGGELDARVVQALHEGFGDLAQQVAGQAAIHLQEGAQGNGVNFDDAAVFVGADGGRVVVGINQGRDAKDFTQVDIVDEEFFFCCGPLPR